jgi:hypothetical protein
MTKKDFEFIAGTLRYTRPPDNGKHREAFEMWKKLVLEFCSRLDATNPRFDSTKFLSAACDDKGVK